MQKWMVENQVMEFANCGFLRPTCIIEGLELRTTNFFFVMATHSYIFFFACLCGSCNVLQHPWLHPRKVIKILITSPPNFSPEKLPYMVYISIRQFPPPPWSLWLCSLWSPVDHLALQTEWFLTQNTAAIHATISGFWCLPFSGAST